MVRPVSIALNVTQPFDWPALIKFFSARVIPGVDQVAESIYSRTFAMTHNRGTVSLSRVSAGKVLATVQCTGVLDEASLRDRLNRLVNARAPTKRITAHLHGDATLARSLTKGPGLRVPGVWDPFELGVRAILGQQVSVAGATTLAGRIALKFGTKINTQAAALTHLFPTPEVLSDADLNGLGLTTRRAATITGFARAVSTTPALLDATKPLEGFVDELVKLNGFGPWTAHYMAMRMGYSDAFPASDLGVRKALNMAPEKEVQKRAESWRPYRATAAMHLWASLSAE